MARHTYDEALKRLLVHEGGYSNHPADPGGATNYGITIGDYRMYVNRNGTARDVKNMSVETAKQIYREKYWNLQRCDELPAGVDYAVFDYGVNSGVGRSGKVLRRLVGLSDHTHKIDDAVIAAAARRDPKMLIDAMCSERMRFLKALRTWKTFGAGWSRRVKEVRAAAQAMAANRSRIPAATEAAPVKPDEPKKDQVTMGGGILAAGAGAGAAVYNWAVENPFLAALIIQGTLIATYLLIRVYQNSKKPEPVPEAAPGEWDDPDDEEAPEDDVKFREQLLEKPEPTEGDRAS
jgi:lysozyme family protein